MIAELFGNAIADLLGIWCGCKLNMWFVSRKIRTLDKDKRCPNCNGSFALNPHIYTSCDYPTKASKPLAGELALVALDDNGIALEHITLKANDGDQAYQHAATLIRTHAPQPLDAIALIEKARGEAEQSDRNVLVVVGGARCGACFLLSRWLDDKRDTLAKEFVVVKIDGGRSLRADEAVKQLTCREPSLPCYAIIDATGKVLITSDGPLGNTGLPNTAEGIRHFRKMMDKSTRHMTAADIDGLIQSLEKRREYPTKNGATSAVN